jgi:cobalt-zinc-cadmium efflux system membrane fusion protein
MKWKLPVAVLVVGAIVTFFAVSSWAQSRAMSVWKQLAAATVSARATAEEKKSAKYTFAGPKRWEGYVTIDDRKKEAIGLSVVEVRDQTEPMRLDVNGSTAYDPNTQSVVRPKFNSRIVKVYVVQGQSVQKGDVLVDVFSKDLAAAKSDYQKATAKWEHDQREYERMDKLFHTKPTPSVSEKDYLLAEIDEMSSRIDSRLAKDALLVYGLTEEEIANIKNESGTEKAKMTLRAPASGVVIRRDAVEGNIYDVNDSLLVIAPLDHFWVWGNVYPSDASKVNIGQDWEIYCPFLSQTIRTKIQSITSDVDADTKTIRIRSQIKNIGGRMKAGMLVSSVVEIPPRMGITVIPRLALVSTDGTDYVYVRKPGRGKGPDRFERRRIHVAEEHNDIVYVSEGLQAGEEVATRGSEILAQMYEDEYTQAKGEPL